MIECTGTCTELLTGDRNSLAAANSSAAVGARQRDRLSWIKPLLQLFAWIPHQHRIRRDEALLLRQSDYMLRDIGIGRSEIELAVRGKARHRP